MAKSFHQIKDKSLGKKTEPVTFEYRNSSNRETQRRHTDNKVQKSGPDYKRAVRRNKEIYS